MLARTGMLPLLAIAVLLVTSLHTSSAAAATFRRALLQKAPEPPAAPEVGELIYTPWECGVIAEGYQLVPGNSWGGTPGEIQKIWTDSQCDIKICAHYVAKYGVVPHTSWANLPDKLKAAWDWQRPDGIGNCNELWVAAAAAGAATTAGEAGTPDAATFEYDAWGCGAIAEGHQLVPGFDWGKTPDPIKTAWTNSACDIQVCAFYVSKYGVVPGTSWGTLPETLQKSWSWRRPGGVGNCDALWKLPL